MRKLGLIAGGGGLPLEVARACTTAERPLFVVRLRGFADKEMDAFPGGESGIAEMGRSIKLLKQAGCEAVCFAGQVNRPDFSNLKPDLRGLAVLPGAIAAASRGDDELLRFLMSEFERDVEPAGMEVTKREVRNRRRAISNRLELVESRRGTLEFDGCFLQTAGAEQRRAKRVDGPGCEIGLAVRGERVQREDGSSNGFIKVAGHACGVGRHRLRSRNFNGTRPGSFVKSYDFAKIVK